MVATVSLQAPLAELNPWGSFHALTIALQISVTKHGQLEAVAPAWADRPASGQNLTLGAHA